MGPGGGVGRNLPGRPPRPCAFSPPCTWTLFRGLPAILVIAFTSLGLPRRPAGAQRALSMFHTRCCRSCSSTAPTSPRCTAPASRASTGARRPRRARSASRTARRCATWSSRRRCAAIIPPLLNDFIGLQKDTALVGFVGAARGPQPGPICVEQRFNLSPVTGVASLLHHHHDPAGRASSTSWSSATRPRMRAGG